MADDPGAWRDVQARLDVQETIYRYCAAYDERDEVSLARLVHDDVVVVSGGEHVGAAAALAFWRSSWDTISASRHHVTNTIVEIGDDGRAMARSCFASLSIVDGESTLVLGTYHDRLVRDGSAWRFVEKRHERSSSGPFAAGLQPPPEPPARSGRPAEAP